MAGEAGLNQTKEGESSFFFHKRFERWFNFPTWENLTGTASVETQPFNFIVCSLPVENTHKMKRWAIPNSITWHVFTFLYVDCETFNLLTPV